MGRMKLFLEELDNKKDIDSKDWRREYYQLEDGFETPNELSNLVEAFGKSSEVTIIDDISKPIRMPKKILWLCGESARDVLLQKPISTFEFITNATPKQIQLILEHSNIDWEGELDFGVQFSIPTIHGGSVDVVIETMRDINDEMKESLAADATRRWLTIDALYIEVTKPTGDNNKLYDPTGRGWHDLNEGLVRKNSDGAKKKNTMYALRSGAKGQFDEDTLKDISQNISSYDLNDIRSGFADGISDPEIDPEKYIQTCDKAGILKRAFPSMELNREFPEVLRSHSNRPLIIAWLLQGNNPELVSYHLQQGWPEWVSPVVDSMLGFNGLSSEDDIHRIAHRAASAGITPKQASAWIRCNSLGKPDWASLASRALGYL